MKLQTANPIEIFFDEERMPAVLLHPLQTGGATLQIRHPYKENVQCTVALEEEELTALRAFFAAVKPLRNTTDGPSLTLGSLATGRLVCGVTSNCDPYRLYASLEVFPPEVEWESLIHQDLPQHVL